MDFNLSLTISFLMSNRTSMQLKHRCMICDPLTSPIHHNDIIELLISSHVTATSQIINQSMLPYCGHFQLHIQFWLLDHTKNSLSILAIIDVGDC